MIYIGIDPGVSGGIALIDGDYVLALKMPATEADLLAMLAEGFINGAIAGQTIRPSHAMLEKAQTMPGMGVVGAFTYGKGYGAIRMALTAARIPFDEVTSPVWQKALQCRSRGDKNVTKRRAQELFPKLTVTHATADALLLAEYGRRLDRGLYATDPRAGQKERQHGKAEDRQGPGAVDGEGQQASTVGQEQEQAWRLPFGFYSTEARATAAAAGRDGGRPDQGAGRRRGGHSRRSQTDERATDAGGRGPQPGAQADEKASEANLAGTRRGAGAGAGRRKAAGADVARAGNRRGRGGAGRP